MALTHPHRLHDSTHKGVTSAMYKRNRLHFIEQLRKTPAKADQQSLDALHFIGLLKDKTKTWALVSHSNGLVAIVMPGDYLGKEHGLVKQIKDDAIHVEKTLMSKKGLEKQTLLLPMR